MNMTTHNRRTRGHALDGGLEAAMRTGKKKARALGDATGDALHDAAVFVRRSGRDTASRTREAPRDMARYLRDNPVKALLWFGLGVAAVGLLGLARRR